MAIIHNVIIDFIAVLIVCVILFAERSREKDYSIGSKLLRILMVCIVMIFLLDIPAWLLDGRQFSGARVLLYFLDTAYWLAQIVYCWLWLSFSDYWNYRSIGRLQKLSLLYALPMLAEFAVIIANIFTGWIFAIDAANVYARGDFYLVNLIPYYLYIIAALAISMKRYLTDTDPGQKQRSLLLCIGMFLPICGVVLETFIYGVSWIWPFTALSLLMVYLNARQQELLEEKLYSARIDAELARSRIAVMLSQIQPHFLYNALSSIKRLCRVNPELAERATIDFSEFLRGNMNSLTMDKPISFELEMEHTRHYLALEKLRFPDALNITYDIQATMFRLPTLTLQPIVENAVRYGVTKKEEGGTVAISTRETDDAFTVTVSDDGVGFDPIFPKSDGRTHIGIQNVRERLERMSGGTLEIKSTPGFGTVAVITIPKGE